ncbi:DUF192 domain-containing protein [Pelistega europaea]|uniref:DUF192 domain-containing protein n=1 Tax=Pelistega europaea TaxID=106147 RepID=A0A7Y4L8Y7_9BURK|nr:DUF192 domain-containing protein [Pelistega europaea]
MQKTRSFALGVFFTVMTSTSWVATTAYADTVSNSSSVNQTAIKALSPLNATTVADLAMTATLHIHQSTINAEIVDDDFSRARGLMYRRELAPNAGMLFVFPDSQRRCFWMHNTFIPLSIAYINHQGTIVDIFDMQPLDETSICSSQDAMFALEVNQGWFTQHHIAVGENIKLNTPTP